MLIGSFVVISATLSMGEAAIETSLFVSTVGRTEEASENVIEIKNKAAISNYHFALSGLLVIFVFVLCLFLFVYHYVLRPFFEEWSSYLKKIEDQKNTNRGEWRKKERRTVQ